MPTYKEGYIDGFKDAMAQVGGPVSIQPRRAPSELYGEPRKKRKLSAWNKFVKANSKKPRFIYRNGKLNLKKMGVAFRKTPAGRKKKR